MPLNLREGWDRGRLKDYESVKEISRNQGGCNNGIFLMRHKREGSHLVLKLVQMSNIARVEKEILSYLRPHASIVKIFDIFVSHGRPQIMGFMMEYCDYGSLHSLINRIDRHKYLLPEHFIWHAFWSLSSGLAYIHHGITDPESPPPRDWRYVVHRDIKPANILLKRVSNSQYPKVLIADFGVAHLSGLPYETRFGEGDRFSGRSDVWMLGYTMVDLILGFNNGMPIPPEFGIDDPRRMGSPLPIKRMSKGLNYILGACLSLNKERRANSRELMVGVRQIFREERPKEERLPEWIWG